MINSITVANYLGESIEIGIGNLDKSGFLISNIEGIGPAKATINSTKMATGDGSFFNASRLEERNIVFTIIFNPDRDVEELRLLTYKYFQVKKPIRLTFKTDRRICYIDGYVETNVPTIFSNREGTQISVLCPDPYFYDLDDGGITETDFSGDISMFEFPFSNESLLEPLIEFSQLRIVTESTVYYEGDSEIGITIRIRALNTVGDISISKVGTSDVMTIRSDKIEKITGQRISKNDEIIISTERNKKGVSLLRNGKYINILNSLDRRSAWFKINRGDNTFSYSASGGEMDIQFRIENRTIFEGV